MSNTIQVQVGKEYIINGDIFRLNAINGPFFILVPIKINNVYHTGADGFVTMKAIQFSKGQLYTGQ